MFYSILLVAAVAALLYIGKRWQHLPPDQRKDFILRSGLWSAVLIIVALVIAGRAHWLMGVLAAIAALGARLARVAQYVPLFRQLFGEFTTSSGQSNYEESQHQRPSRSGDMSRQEAADILGVHENATADEVRTAHKRLMQKIHPDRGGTDALASQINQAKDVLLA